MIKKISDKSRGHLIDISQVGINTFDGVHFNNMDYIICHKIMLASLVI